MCLVCVHTSDVALLFVDHDRVYTVCPTASPHPCSTCPTSNNPVPFYHLNRSCLCACGRPPLHIAARPKDTDRELQLGTVVCEQSPRPAFPVRAHCFFQYGGFMGILILRSLFEKPEQHLTNELGKVSIVIHVGSSSLDGAT